MADIADRAAEQNAAAEMADLSRRMPEGPIATGACLYCGSGLPHGMRWCDKACQKDWQVEEDAKRRNGK